MAYLHWTSDLETGIAVIDKQHRRIVDFINELNDTDGLNELATTNHVLDKLVEYTRVHFSSEEEMLKNMNYPYLKAHKRIHELFIKRVAEIQYRVRHGENVIQELLPMLRNWLINHIKGEDAHYVESISNSLLIGEHSY